MIDTERDYVKSLQYIMDVSQLRFLRIQFLSVFGCLLSFNLLSRFFLCSVELFGGNEQSCFTAIIKREKEYSVWEHRKDSRLSQTVRL